MKAGYATALDLLFADSTHNVPKLVFVVAGERTSVNPIKAFKQGLQDTAANEAFLLRGHRCSACGRVELLALDQIPWTP